MVLYNPHARVEINLATAFFFGNTGPQRHVRSIVINIIGEITVGPRTAIYMACPSQTLHPPCEHFMNQNPQRPPVHRSPVPFALPEDKSGQESTFERLSLVMHATESNGNDIGPWCNLPYGKLTEECQRKEAGH